MQQLTPREKDQLEVAKTYSNEVLIRAVEYRASLGLTSEADCNRMYDAMAVASDKRMKTGSRTRMSTERKGYARV